MRTTHPDLSIAVWRKSSHSGSGSGCVVIAEQYPDLMPIGDSKDLSRAKVIVPRAAFASLVGAVAATPDGDLRA
ncbi:DUF397 domain-containing protein [Streptomyces griseocarneus]|nr:DUF397 domain-containing protein [Streptomyces griseocarneus]